MPGGAPLSANYWIGFTDQDNEGDFEWVTGEAPSFTNWAEGEPNDFGSGEDFAAIRWTVTCEDEECTSEAFWNDLADTGEQGFERLGPFSIVEFEPAAENVLYFAQFADGDGLSSQITLLNTAAGEASAQILLRDNSGLPLAVDLNGMLVNGQLDVDIPASGVGNFETDSMGGVTVGSVTVTSDRPLAGVILFSGPGLGLAGVGSSVSLAAGFGTAVEQDEASGIRTGIAVQNLEDDPVNLTFELFDNTGAMVSASDGTRAGGGTVSPMPGLGHFSLFVDELVWNPPVGFSDFRGLIKVNSSGRVAATAIQTRPGQFATLPVTPR